MNKKLIATTLIASLAMAGAAQAAGPFAFADLSIAKGDLTGQSYSDDSDFGFSLGGGYLFNDMIGAEIGYVSFGDMGLSATESVDGNGWLLGGRVLIPVSDGWNAFGRIGMTNWDLDYNAPDPSKADGNDLYFGVGGGFAMSEQVSVTAGWTRYTMDATDWDTEFTFDHWGVGLLMQY